MLPETLTTFSKIFDSLSKIFGSAFTREYPQRDDAIKIWARTLKHLTREQLAYGLDKCGQWTHFKPPTVPQFRMLCEEKKIAQAIDNRKAPPRLDEIGVLVEKGAEIAKLLKKIYPEKSWWELVAVLTDYKKTARTAYPNITEIARMTPILQEVSVELKEKLAQQQEKTI